MGYSNILFGIMMLEALMGGERERSLFGMVKVRKIYIPVIMMIIIQISMPQASLVGHFAGIISALILKKTGLHYLLLPRQSWI